MKPFLSDPETPLPIVLSSPHKFKKGEISKYLVQVNEDSLIKELIIYCGL